MTIEEAIERIGKPIAVSYRHKFGYMIPVSGVLKTVSVYRNDEGELRAAVQIDRRGPSIWVQLEDCQVLA